MRYFRSTVRYLCRIADSGTAIAIRRCHCLPARPARQFAQISLLLLLVGAGPTVQGASEQKVMTPALSLERAVATATEGNPGLAEMQARAEAMAAIPSQVGALPDPTVSLNALNL